MLGNRLLRRFTLAYCLMIILPSMVLLGYLYDSMMQRIRTEYAESQTKLMAEAVTTVETKLANIEKASESIQFSQVLLSTLENADIRDVDVVYNYVSEIQDLFSNVINYNAALKKLRIYTSNDSVSALLLEFLPISNLPADVDPKLRRAYWALDEGEAGFVLSYYSPLYDRRVSRPIALLALQCNSAILEPVISWQDNAMEYALFQGSRLVYSTLPEGAQVGLSDLIPLTRDEPAQVEADTARGILNSQFYIESLDLRVVLRSRLATGELFGRIPLMSVALVVLLFVVLSSAVFYFIIFRPVRDITRLTAHINDSAGRAMQPYSGTATDDEIGELIHSYNELVDSNNQMIVRMRQSDSLRKNAQLSALQAQIDPHFFYGTLESIHMIAEANDEPLIAEIALDFSGLMRYSLNRKTAGPLSEEIAIVRRYLNIQQKRLGDRFQTEWSVEVDCDDLLCPKFVLQPLVENVIVHGVSKTRRAVHIRIRVWRRGEDVCISVCDDGPGISPERLEYIRAQLQGERGTEPIVSEHNGRGIVNIHRRLQLYYGSGYGVQVASEPFRETRFSIVIKQTFDEELCEEEADWTS